MRPRTFTPRRLSGHQAWLFALACLLPWVQSLALWHGYGHVPAQLRAVAQAQPARVMPVEAQDLACALCVAAHAVLAAAPPLAPAAPLVVSVNEGLEPGTPSLTWRRLPCAAYAARAPPVHLS
jgi:hypothetical protein